MPVASGCGQMSSLSPSRRGTHARASSGGITSTHGSGSGRSRPLSERRRSPRRRGVIRFGTHGRPIGSKRGTTFGPCRYDSGTTTSVRRCVTPTCGIGVVAGSRVRRTCGRGRAERGVSLAGNLPSYVAYGAIFVRPLIFGDAPSHREETGFVRHERTRRAGDYISRCETVVGSVINGACPW
jgi:hypothetical protein